MITNIVRNPILSIQCDWKEVLRSKNAKVWISCREPGANSTYGEIVATEVSPGSLNFKTSNGFHVERNSDDCILLSHEDPNCQASFVYPRTVFSKIHKAGILSLDANDGGLGLSVCTNNKLLVWDLETGDIRRELAGHVWDVYTCKFFPSGVVILSAGADMQLKIWSAETGDCPVTLKGHTAAIMDTAIVEKGRNIISVSKDGTAKLWDCGQSKLLSNLIEVNGYINCCSVASVEVPLDNAVNNNSNDREVGTEGKVLVLGCENKNLLGVDVRNRKQIFSFDCADAVNCCSFLSPLNVICGTQNGQILYLDIRRPGVPVMCWEDSSSPILCCKLFRNGFITGRGDGSCSWYKLNSDMKVNFSGPDCDPIYSLAAVKNHVITACRDGRIRKYNVPN